KSINMKDFCKLTGSILKTLPFVKILKTSHCFSKLIASSLTHLEELELNISQYSYFNEMYNLKTLIYSGRFSYENNEIVQLVNLTSLTCHVKYNNLYTNSVNKFSNLTHLYVYDHNALILKDVTLTKLEYFSGGGCQYHEKTPLPNNFESL